MAADPQELPETVALRFRDFGVETIPEHNAIAAASGKVWWGWWQKPEETTPQLVLQEFDRRIGQDGSIEIFLVDSGHERLYRARIDAIFIAPGLQEEDRSPAPDTDLVPPYYRDRSWRVWFRFTGQIEELEEDAIKDWTYQEVAGDVLIEDPHSQAYDQKRVYDLREMLGRRHRTMYFLRRRRDGDSEGQIELVAPDHPRPFSTVPYSPKSDYMVVLSDLHFSEDRDQHGYALVTQAGDPDLLDVLDEERLGYFEGKAPAAVLVTGDLTWQGTQAQFELARTFLSRLQSIWGLDWSQLIVIPGNHDITWTQAPGPPGAAATAAAEAGYRTFLGQAVRFNPGEQLSMGRRYLLSNFVPVDIVALNSVRLESGQFAGYGFVGADQVREAFEQMGWTRGPKGEPRIRVLALHHHVVPVAPQENLGDSRYSLTLDAGELLYTALEYGVDLVLHGHQHKPFAAAFSRMGNTSDDVARRTLPIHGLGSVGVAAQHLPGGERNAYSVLRVGADRITVEVRQRSLQQAHAFREAWKTELDRTPHGFLAAELQR
ncbi:MAG: hypothetical protein V7607_2551 [Solirubrobacteraceae bacterium]